MRKYFNRDGACALIYEESYFSKSFPFILSNLSTIEFSIDANWSYVIHRLSRIVESAMDLFSLAVQ